MCVGAVEILHLGRETKEAMVGAGVGPVPGKPVCWGTYSRPEGRGEEAGGRCPSQARACRRYGVGHA